MVAWVFYARSGFVPSMVPYHQKTDFDGPDAEKREMRRREWTYRSQRKANLRPLVFIALSLVSYTTYTWMLDQVLTHLMVSTAVEGKTLTRSTILSTAGVDFSIPYHAVLQMLYLGIFLFAEAAFVLMALREYAYGVLKISESDVLQGPFISAVKRTDPPMRSLSTTDPQ